MALIECPECKKQISDKAHACIHCGYPISKIKPQNEHIEQHPIEDANLDTSIQPQHQVAETRSAPEEQLLKPHMDSQTKKKITIAVVSVLLIMFTVWIITVAIENKASRKRNLSNVFDISFDMTMEDIIEYEAKKYGNTDYNFDPKNNRLDFEKYGYNDWKHMYFFDKKTGLLNSVHYWDIFVVGNDSSAECEHIRIIKGNLLKEIGEWDENPTGSIRKVAYGKINGIPCKVTYYDGATQQIILGKDEKK